MMTMRELSFDRLAVIFLSVEVSDEFTVPL